VSDSQRTTTARGDRDPVYPLPPRLPMPDPTADPARMAEHVTAAVVPGFADAASVFALEELLSGGGLPTRVPRARQARLVVRTLATTATAAGGRLAPSTAFPAGEVVAFAADSPCSQCVLDAAPMIFSRASRSTLRRITPAAATAIAQYASFLTAPMITRGRPVGVLALARTPHAPAFGGADARAAADLAARAGGAFAGSLALMRRQSVAEALQRPRPGPAARQPGGLEIAGRCLPAAGTDVGGDWYDIIPLPDGRTGLVVGDVMGHGPQAAAVMTRLSAAAYTLADADLPPSELLRQLNRTALALPRETLATCAYAVIDPAAGSCTIATAGHLPPVLALPGGPARVPGIPGGQSLGITPASYGQARIRLRPGTTLCLYTDGLVETRTRPFDQGILALQTAIARQYPDLATACEEVITSLGDRREDDITIVLARIPNAPS